MSNRAVRKLVGNDDIIIDAARNLEENVEDNSSLDGQEDFLDLKPDRSKPWNRFELLNALDSDAASHTEAKEDDDKDVDDSASNGDAKLPDDQGRTRNDSLTHASLDLGKRKRKKKKKAKKGKDPGISSQDEIEAGLQEVEKLLGAYELSPTLPSKASKHEKNLLTVEARHLNTENELKRFFGSKVVLAEMNISRKRKPKSRLTVRPWVLVNPRNQTLLARPSFSMELSHIDEGNLHYFYFVHSKSYQNIQHQFLEIIDSSNIDALGNLTSAHPYLIDALIQFSDICELMGENQTAASLIERALHCFELTFHPLFNVTQTYCRLDYKRAENRSFFVALFRHKHFISLKGLNRTALELCKLLYNLDPDNDPLAIICVMDYYALRSEQFDFLASFYEHFKESKMLYLLPNWRYSYALALYLQSEAKKDPDLLEKSSKALQDALINFPNFVLPLLDKCSVEPDKNASTFFNKLDPTPNSLGDLIHLYLTRAHMLWNKKEIIYWLENNVNEILKIFEKNPSVALKYRDIWSKFSKHDTPKNVIRHIFLSHLTDLISRLPPEIKSHSILAFDPLPPSDSTTDYPKLARRQRPSPQHNQSLFSTFFHSILPNFNLEELNRNQPVREAVPEQAQDGQNEGYLANNDIRRSLTSLFDAMRDLLTVFEANDGQNEGDIESGDDNASDADQAH